MMKKQSIITALVVLFSCTLSHAEVITLKDGRVIEGKIIEETDDYIKVKDEWLSLDITYFKDSIKEISKTASAPAKDAKSQAAEELKKQREQIKQIEEKQTRHDNRSLFIDAFTAGANGNFRDAESILRKVFGENDDDTLAMALVNLLLDANKGQAKKEFAVAVFAGLYDAAISNDNENAVIKFEAAGKLMSNESSAYGFVPFLGLGMANYGLSKYEAAVAHLQKAKLLKPDFGLVHFFLGQAYYNLDNIDEAEKSFTEALKLFLKNPGYSSAQQKTIEYLEQILSSK